MTTNEVLLDAPVFSVAGFTQTARTALETGGERFPYSYVAPVDAVEGVREPKVHLIDTSGNESDLAVGPLRLDFTAPAVVAGAVTVRPDLARPGEMVLVQVAFTEPLGAPPSLSVGDDTIAALSSAGAFASFSVAIRGTTPDGLLGLGDL